MPDTLLKTDLPGFSGVIWISVVVNLYLASQNIEKVSEAFIFINQIILLRTCMLIRCVLVFVLNALLCEAQQVQ